MGGGGGCGDFCCIANCGFCCIGDFFSGGGGGGCCVGNCCVSDSPSIKDPQEEHAAKIANELAEMRTKSGNDANKQEEDIIKEINETMTEFIKWLQDVNKKKYGGRTLNINIEKIKSLNLELHNKVVGFIGKKLDDKLVQTDSEVSIILAEPNDKKRKKNFDDFYQARLRDAIRDLIKMIEVSVREQSESIEQEIKNRIQEVNNSMNEETKAFEELQQMKAEENSRVAEKQIECMYYENLCDIMYDQLTTSSIIGK